MRKTLGILLAGALALGLTNCGPKATMKMKTETTPETKLEREGPGYKIERLGIFEDDLAYGGKRGIYEITDTETGEKYFGISGIGITELGSHAIITSNGKSTVTIVVPDER